MKGISNLKGKWKFAYVHSFKVDSYHYSSRNYANFMRNDTVHNIFLPYVQEKGYEVFSYASLHWHCLDFKKLGLSRFEHNVDLFKGIQVPYLNCDNKPYFNVNSFQDIFNFMNCNYKKLCKDYKNNPIALKYYKNAFFSQGFYGAIGHFNDFEVVTGSSGVYTHEYYHLLIRKVCNA